MLGGGHPDHQAAVAGELAPEAERAGQAARDEPDVVADVGDERGEPGADQDREADQGAGADGGQHEAGPEARREARDDEGEVHPQSRSSATSPTCS